MKTQNPMIDPAHPTDADRIAAALVFAAACEGRPVQLDTDCDAPAVDGAVVYLHLVGEPDGFHCWTVTAAEADALAVDFSETTTVFHGVDAMGNPVAWRVVLT